MGIPPFQGLPFAARLPSRMHTGREKLHGSWGSVMFDKIKNLFGKSAEHEPRDTDSGELRPAEGDIYAMSKEAQAAAEKLAKARKLIFAPRPEQRGYTLDGQIQGKPYKIERGSPSREYVQGVELRARCDLGVSPNAVLMVVNRHLKKSLDENTYSAFTDTMETMVNTHLPEEVMWMTMYGEVGWHDLGERFISDYCILAEDKHHARALVDAKLVKALTSWPAHSLTRPVIFMLMRGRLYMRMQFDDDSFMLEHALDSFELFCSNILANKDLLAQES